MQRHYPLRVAAFGHPRIHAGWRLPEAYRSLPRPSSAPGAKASPVRPNLRHARSLAGAPHAGSCALLQALYLLRSRTHALAEASSSSVPAAAPPGGGRAVAPTDQHGPVPLSKVLRARGGRGAKNRPRILPAGFTPTPGIAYPNRLVSCCCTLRRSLTLAAPTGGA